MARRAANTEQELRGPVEGVRQQFLDAVDGVRPRLHRFCTRMCGSALDGEDVVQETLEQAFFRLPSLQDAARLEAWLFRIAHRKCLDFLRRERRHREGAVPFEELPQDALEDPSEDSLGDPIDMPLAALVGELPPRERATVLLKDVLEYRLAEVADIVDSTVGAVKAALHRGRAKLRALEGVPSCAELDGQQRRLLAEYVERFNHRDWDGLRSLIRDDARLEVVGTVDARLGEAGRSYFGNYAAIPWEWRVSAVRVDGEPVLGLWRRSGSDWRLWSVTRLWWNGHLVIRIRDYFHAPYLVEAATVEAEPR